MYLNYHWEASILYRFYFNIRNTLGLGGHIKKKRFDKNREYIDEKQIQCYNNEKTSYLFCGCFIGNLFYKL